MTKDEALLRAIIALENPNSGLVPHNDEWLSLQSIAIKACKEALEQPTQEPVAWMNDIAFSMDKDELTADKFGDIVPLYTYPKEWQGLSEDEIRNIANFLGKNKQWDYPVMFAKTIEKALKEKNT